MALTVTKFVQSAEENPVYVLSYTGSQLDYVEATVLSITYRKTLTWTGSNLTAVSAWVVQ